MTRFPIERARYRSIWYPVIISSACIAGYGWALHIRTVGREFLRHKSANCVKSVAVPLILQFLIGAMISVVFNVSQSSLPKSIVQLLTEVRCVGLYSLISILHILPVRKPLSTSCDAVSQPAAWLHFRLLLIMSAWDGASLSLQGFASAPYYQFGLFTGTGWCGGMLRLPQDKTRIHIHK